MKIFPAPTALVVGILLLAFATLARCETVDLREETVAGQGISTINDNFRRLSQDKLDKQGVKALMQSGTVIVVLPTVDITVTTATVVNQLVQTSDHIFYIAASTAGVSGWIKVGSQ